MKSFANALLDSSAAAAAVGPTIACRSAANRSTTPRLNGSSGPTTVRSTCSRFATASSVSGLVGSAGKQRAISAIPGLPGAQMIEPTPCSRDNFHANACSLAPLPTTRIFITAAVNYLIDNNLLRGIRAGGTRKGKPDYFVDAAR